MFFFMWALGGNPKPKQIPTQETVLGTIFFYVFYSRVFYTTHCFGRFPISPVFANSQFARDHNTIVVGCIVCNDDTLYLYVTHSKRRENT